MFIRDSSSEIKFDFTSELLRRDRRREYRFIIIKSTGARELQEAGRDPTMTARAYDAAATTEAAAAA